MFLARHLPAGPWRRGRRRAFAVTLVGLAAVLALGACSGSSGDGGSASGDPSSASSGNSSSGSDSTPTPTKPPGPAVSVAVSPAAGRAMNPVTPVVVKATDGMLADVTVKNKVTGRVVQGGYGAGRSTWHSSEVLGYGKSYSVAVTAKDKDGKVLHKNTSLKVMDPPTAYPNVVPPPSISSIGVGMPIAVRFGSPLKAVKDRAAVQKDLSITSNPPQAGGWYWLSDTEVDYRPATYWKPGTRITLHINVYGKDLGGGIYGETDRTVTYRVHDSWIAKADGQTEHMVIYHNGAAVKTMNISMGKQQTPTHLGTHVISDKQNPYIMDSCTYGVCKGEPGYYRSTEYYAERISDDGEFVHENPNSVSAQGSTNVSHGCINLNESDAAWFYARFGIGDVVEVTNSGGPPLPLTDRIGVWAVPWAEWQAGNAGA